MAKLTKNKTAQAAAAQITAPHSLTSCNMWMCSDARYEAMVEALAPTRKPYAPKPVTMRRFSWEKQS